MLRVSADGSTVRSADASVGRPGCGVMALTDGPVDQRIEQLRFDRIEHPLHPFDRLPDDWRPDVVVLPAE